LAFWLIVVSRLRENWTAHMPTGKINNKRSPRAAAESTGSPPTRAPIKQPLTPPTSAAVAKPTIHVLSDSTGNLPRHILTALLTQFPPKSIAVRFENFVRTPQQVDKVIDRAARHRGIVCHAIVSAELKQRVSVQSKAANVACFDLTGGIVEFLEKTTGVPTRGDTEALHRMDDAYRRRIGAMEFTLGHDDGLGLDTLHEADVVLVGVSRTSKTPTSILLAQQGYQAANISLAMGVEPPAQLALIPVTKVVGLVIDPSQLAMIRNRRQAAWGMAPTPYGDPANVAREVAWSRTLFQRLGWPILDVTDQAVEETAARVIEMLGLSSLPIERATLSGDLLED
jgi:regulator of PEP synthase PpsR (kinase-PPPase family)